MKSHAFIINYLLLELVLILFFIPTPKAQTPGFITGIVKDAGTGLPIENVNITLYQTTRGTISNSRGIFKIRISDFPAVLQFSHVSYYKKSIAIKNPGTDTINVLLTQRPVNLNEAEIISGKYKVLKDENKEVVDYDFIDTNLLVLIRNMNTLKYELIITNDRFDTISKLNISTVKHPKSIFKDCMGNCHLLTKDSAYQVYYNNQTIQLLFPVNLNRFKMLLGNCLFETPKYLVFNYKSNTHPELMYAARKPEDITKPSKNGNWKQQFYAIDKQTHHKKIIDEFDEREKRREAFEYALFLYEHPIGDTQAFGAILRFNEMVYFKPSFQSMQYLNDTIYYFNHLKSCIYLYSDSLSLLDTIHISYNNRDNWKQKIITDKIKNKAYTVFMTGTKLTLSEIDLKSGHTKQVTTIDKTFPARVKVNNGFLYFLYINTSNEWGKRALYQGELP